MSLINAISSFKVFKMSPKSENGANSVDFSPNGNYVMANGDFNEIRIFNWKWGSLKGKINSMNCSEDLLRYVNDETTAIRTSMRETVLLSLENGQYIRCFTGHTHDILNLSVSPIRNTFLTGATDGSIRLWDLRLPDCGGVLSVPQDHIASFDPSGLSFAVGTNSKHVKLFDIRSYTKGPRTVFTANYRGKGAWSGLKFSNDGKKILISTNGNKIHLIDAFSGILLQNFCGFINHRGATLEAAFSPDSEYVFGGSTVGNFVIWSVEDPEFLEILDSGEPHSSLRVHFNPKRMMFVSAGTHLAFWIPSVSPRIRESL